MTYSWGDNLYVYQNQGCSLYLNFIPDFEKNSIVHFTWVSFIVSSVMFGLMHGRWLAGILAGMAFAIALYRKGQLSDAIVAHGVANALIAANVLLFDQWSLWE